MSPCLLPKVESVAIDDKMRKGIENILRKLSYLVGNRPYGKLILLLFLLFIWMQSLLTLYCQMKQLSLVHSITNIIMH